MFGNKVYVLHEHGARSHYYGLETCARRKGYIVCYREFQNFRNTRIIKIIQNFLFLLSLPFRNRIKVVVGIAPYNSKLSWLMTLLTHHDVYYHTSYSCWDGSHSAYPIKNVRLAELWKHFTKSYVKHVFAVSLKTKKELVENGYCDSEHITVVNHSYNIRIEAQNQYVKDNSFIQVGRLNSQKGVEELLLYFRSHPNAQITFVGDGILREKVEEYSFAYPNINYAGYIKGLDNLVPLYKEHSFLILNSHRTEKWEELFGIAIVEGMACGCVPLTTDHSGPREIITNGMNGWYCQEGNIADLLDKACSLSQCQYENMRQQAVMRGKEFYQDNIACRWEKIFE